MIDWLPIVTAPTDETPVLLWNGWSHDMGYVAWHDHDDKPVWFNGDVTVDATHWMPLPPDGPKA